MRVIEAQTNQEIAIPQDQPVEVIIRLLEKNDFIIRFVSEQEIVVSYVGHCVL